MRKKETDRVFGLINYFLQQIGWDYWRVAVRAECTRNNHTWTWGIRFVIWLVLPLSSWNACIRRWNIARPHNSVQSLATRNRQLDYFPVVHRLNRRANAGVDCSRTERHSRCLCVNCMDRAERWSYCRYQWMSERIWYIRSHRRSSMPNADRQWSFPNGLADRWPRNKRKGNDTNYLLRVRKTISPISPWNESTMKWVKSKVKKNNTDPKVRRDESW